MLQLFKWADVTFPVQFFKSKSQPRLDFQNLPHKPLQEEKQSYKMTLFFYLCKKTSYVFPFKKKTW